MARRRLIALALPALASVSIGGFALSGASFSSATTNPSNRFQGAVDWVGPSIASAAIAHTSGGTAVGTPGYVRASDTYRLYANVSDAVSGVGTVAADLRSISGAASGNISLTAGAYTVGGQTYNYASAETTASASLADGVKPYSVTATDTAGNSTVASLSVTADSTAPTATVSDPGSPLRSTVSLSGTATDAGSGIASVAFQYTSAGGSSWSTACTATTSPYSCSFSTTTVTDGLYDLRAVATDTAGNTKISTVVSNRRVDNTPPTTSLTDPGSYLHATTTLTGSAADSGSGVASVAFQYTSAGGGSWSTICSATTSPYSCSFDTTVVADGLYDLRTVATDAAGNTTTSTIVAGRRIDNTAPAGGSITYTNGYYRSASVAVSFTQGTDGGSGLNVSSGLLQRASAPLTGGNCGTFGSPATIASNPTSPVTDTGVTSGNCYQYRYVVSDNAGNPATYTSAATAKVDTQGPTHSLSLASPSGAFLSGTTLFYKGNASGSFRLVDTLADSASGPASATFPAIGTTGWTHAAETVSTPSGGPYTSSVFSWSANPSGPATYTVSGQDNAGNSSSAAGLTFTSDTTPPSGGGLSYAGTYSTLSVPITTTNGSDTQSGVNAASGIVMRREMPFTLGLACPLFLGGYTTQVTLVGGADTTVQHATCYQYEYLVSDNVGNQATYTSSDVAKVN